MTERQAQLLIVLVEDQADWDSKMWGLINQGFTPQETADALNLLSKLAGKPQETTVADCTPR